MERLPDAAVVQLRQTARWWHVIGVLYVVAALSLLPIARAVETGAAAWWLLVVAAASVGVGATSWLRGGSEEVRVTSTAVTRVRRVFGCIICRRSVGRVGDGVEFLPTQARPDAMFAVTAEVGAGRVFVVTPDGGRLRIAGGLFRSTDEMREIADVLEGALQRSSTADLKSVPGYS